MYNKVGRYMYECCFLVSVVVVAMTDVNYHERIMFCWYDNVLLVL